MLAKRDLQLMSCQLYGGFKIGRKVLLLKKKKYLVHQVEFVEFTSWYVFT